MAVISKHGIVRNIPARVINIQSRKRNERPTQIRLDKLLRSPNPKICINRRLGGIGDVIMTTPVLRALKKLVPRCHLTYATDLEYSQQALAHVIEHNPYVDDLISFHSTQGKSYDYSIDITSTGLNKEKSGSIPPNRIDMFAEAVGVSIEDNPLPIYEVKSGERDWAKQEIKEKYLLGAKKQEVSIIAVQARSNDARRTWPLDYVKELCSLLAENETYRILLFDWGHESDRWESAPRLFPIVKMPLPQVAALIEQSNVVVCPDSALLHLAGALQKKIVAIFGPIPPESRINYYSNATGIQLPLPCKNCWYSPRCTKDSGNSMSCLTKITPNMVKEAVDKKLMEPLRVGTSMNYGKDISVGGQDPIILVKRDTRGFGDLIMATTGIEALKKKFPNKELHVAVDKSLMEVLENNPYIDKVEHIRDGINPRRYYLTVNISTPCARYETTRVNAGRRVEKSRVEIFAEALDTRNIIPDLKPRYYISEEEILWAKKFLKPLQIKGRPTIALSLKTAEKYRDWPEEKYQGLISQLYREFNLVLLHHNRRFFFDHTIDACGLPLRKAMGLLSLCDGLISADTGTLHVAAALDIPTVALFGPIDYRARCKGYKNVTVMTSDLDCIPCWRNSSGQCKKTGKTEGYSACLEKIPAKKIAKVARDKFRGINGRKS
jgi:heptosyltransferase-2